jgi:hypothetical protein
MNFVRGLSAKARVLAAMIGQLNPGKRLKINSHDSDILTAALHLGTYKWAKNAPEGYGQPSPGF